MIGPEAPRDPVEKGSSFYICRQKAVAGNPRPDGTGVQFLYLNDGRMVTFARLAGNITDEAMLEKLKTAEGFLEMVAGIGVSVEAADREETVDFVFQMYGKRDPNHSGTTIRVSCVPDGREQVIWLDQVAWSGDDDIPGQIRFEFPKAGMLAAADVKLYLRKGFTAPRQEETFEVDPSSQAYQEMLRRSLVQLGNPGRLKNVIRRAREGKEVTIAFIGGSITQGAGAVPIHKNCYAYQTFLRFRETFGSGDNVHFIKAGVGGTPSELGMIRFERDVLREGTVIPDLVVVEFAVNDEGDETKGCCYECLVRKIMSVSRRTAAVLLFSVFANDENLQERLIPVGERYGLPMVSIKDAAVEQFYEKSGEGRVLSKSQFFYDSYHPSNMGHAVMADCLMYLFRQADQAEEAGEDCWMEKSPVYGTDFANVRLLDKRSNLEKAVLLEPGSFCCTDEALQMVEMDDSFEPSPQFSYNWQHRQGRQAFRMILGCKALLLVSKDSGEITAGKAEVFVDGRKILTADPRAVGWIHCHAQILFSEEETREHLIEIRMAEGEEQKEFTILGFGFVE